MQNVKDTIEYFLDVLSAFGVDYMCAEDFRQAKHSQAPSSEMQKFQRLVFDLLLLNMTQFKLKLKDKSLEIKDYQKMRQFILSCLSSMNCELLIQHPLSNQLAFNFNNMRDLLLLVGWIIGVANIFERYEEVCVHEALREVENMRDDSGEDHIEEDSTSSQINMPRKSQGVKDQNECSEERLVESYNIAMSTLRTIQTLGSRAHKKIQQFQSKLSVTGGVQIPMKQFFLMTKPELLKTKTYQINAITMRINEIIPKMRNQEIFWAWLESVVDSDKKEYCSESDYGYAGGEDILVGSAEQLGLQELTKRLSQENQFIEMQLSQISENISAFNGLWAITQKNMKTQYNEQEIEDLRESSDFIVEDIDQKLPQFEDYYGQEQEDQNDKNYCILASAVQELLGDDNKKQQSKDSSEIQIKEAEKMMEVMTKKHDWLESRLQQNIDQLLEQITPIVTTFPKRQRNQDQNN